MKRSLTSTLALTLAATGAAPALAELKYENNSGGHVVLYGQFNPAIISVDDGQQRETNLLDNDLSRSRIGLRVLQPFDTMTFEFRFETGLGFPNSTEVNQLGEDYSGFTRADLRHFDFSLKGDWGKVYLGQGPMAADGAAEVDLSLVGTALYAYTADGNGGFLFRDAAGLLSGPSVDGTLGTFDGSRRTRIRYDTPDFNGFSGSVAWGRNELSSTDDSDYYDIALRYERDLGTARFAAAAAYQVRDTNSIKRKDTVVSASLLLDSGFSFTASAGNRENDAAGATDPSYYYAKLGYEADWFSYGKTGVGVHYYDGSDFDTAGSDTEGWGIGLVQQVTSINTDVYVTYQQYEHTAAGADYQDLRTLVVGTRWKF